MTETLEQQLDGTSTIDVDSLLAERVMHWTRYGDVWRDKHGLVMAQVATPDNVGVCGVFRPSSDDASAFRVVDQFKRPHWRFQLDHGPHGDDSWFAFFGRDKPLIWATATAETRCLAICRAAYKAMKALSK